MYEIVLYSSRSIISSRTYSTCIEFNECTEYEGSKGGCDFVRKVRAQYTDCNNDKFREGLVRSISPMQLRAQETLSFRKTRLEMCADSGRQNMT